MRTTNTLINSEKLTLFCMLLLVDTGDNTGTQHERRDIIRLPMNAFQEAIFNESSGMRLYIRLIYATADEADAYMFYRCFFSVFVFVFCFFPSVKKYQTTVLGNG